MTGDVVVAQPRRDQDHLALPRPRSDQLPKTHTSSVSTRAAPVLTRSDRDPEAVTALRLRTLVARSGLTLHSTVTVTVKESGTTLAVCR